jgi:hypothetical protein
MEIQKKRYHDNIKTDLKEIMWEGVDWICLAQNRDQQHAVANMVMRHWVAGRADTNRNSAIWC